ncbi:MAG: hypothetical protein ACR2M8_07440 [Pyrinomonadaceae bacterium]|nr:hypothetical protein [Blastocatellia bacterium]MDQ3221636.1 hypothetical protein [Acidobacteriota bacterium]MDQ3491190.1 hypothetical protein [Acidobacteriota bacterium]
MRTTVTLDDDVLLTVKEEMRKGEGKTFKEALNGLVRRARYASENGAEPPKPFKVRAKSLGVYPHLNYDKTSKLLEMLDEAEYK